MTAPIATLGSPIPPAVARYLAAVASRAPSVHNTQPWRYNYTEAGAVELHADFTRQLPVTDPTGRELHISCGAALFGLRLAIRNLSYLPVITMRPVVSDPSLLARLLYGEEAPPSRADQTLLHAMGWRHTHRDVFTTEPVPTTLLPALQRICEAEGTQLVFLQDPADRQRLADLVATAHGCHHRNPAMRRELLAWTPPPQSHSRDGVPAAAYLSRQQPPARGELLGRDFALDRPWGRVAPAAVHGAGAIAVLTTTADSPAAWLAAGQALHHLLLAAAHQGVLANLHTEPLELPHLREVLTRQLPLGGFPQMVLSLGTAKGGDTSPRRSVSDTLTVSASSESAKVWLT